MMAQEAPEGSAFGLLSQDQQDPEGLLGEQPEEQTETSADESAPTDEDRRYAGKYDSVEALETGYNEAQAWGTRASQEAAELRRAYESQQAQVTEMRQVLEALAPSILQQQFEENPELAGQLEQAQRMQALVDQQVAPYRQQVEQLQQAQQVDTAQAQLALRVGQWRQRTGVAPGSPEDVSLAQAVSALDLDIVDAETGHLALDLALEASRDPDLLTVLKVNPHWIEIDGGIEEARRQAAMRRGQVPQSNGSSRHAAAYVETGGQGAPTQGAPGGSKDEFDEAIAAYNAEKKSPLLF